MRFKDLYGQVELRRAFTGMLSAGRVSHAMLICGPPGSGKRSWGLAMAGALLCADRKDGEACGGCRSCRLFQSASHPDLFHIQPQGRRLGIDQFRSIRSSFYLEGGNRVCLIEEAEQMTPEACASLLKILEEPPPALYFILLTGRLRSLPGTIVSRCQRFTLHPLNSAEILELLEHRRGLPPEKAFLLSRLSKGLPGLALRMAEDPAFEECLDEALELACNLTADKLSSRELLSIANSLAGKEDLPFFLELLCIFYRDGLIYLLCRNEALLLSPAKVLQWAAGTVTPAALEGAMSLLHKLSQELGGTNVNRRLALEGTLFQLKRRFASCQ
ncbi:MAG: DNA polymerase III subunit delta' [Firmicutes bacterium]|nr:DNA polymerase III subunit delta' [Bacillota bacterium]